MHAVVMANVSESATPSVASCSNKNYKTINDMNSDSVECILSSKGKISNLPRSAEPFLIIKYGPTGSGKGSRIVQEEISRLGVPLEDYAVFEIDKLVESIQSYRNQTMNVKKNRNSKKINLNGEMYKRLTKIYFDTRKSTNRTGKSLNSKMNDILSSAIQQNINIIFETTGTYFSYSSPIEWLIQQAVLQKYKIVVIYPIVSTSELIRRVDKRAINQSSLNKPFYRAIDTSKIEEQSLYAKMNLTHFLLPSLFSKRIYKIIAFWNE